jgi:TPR repeat protein
MYATGEGTARDLAEARKWMQKATASGDADAREWLAAHPS